MTPNKIQKHDDRPPKNSFYNYNSPTYNYSLREHIYRNKKDIIRWLDDMEITNYTLIPNKDYTWVVNTQGDVNLTLAHIHCLRVQFNCVKGNFHLPDEIQTLEGCPNIVSDDFCCMQTKIKSLIGGPSVVGRDFIVEYNKLTSLSGAPISVGRDFSASNNDLISLQNMTQVIGRDIYLGVNKLSTLEGLPYTIYGKVCAEENKLISLKGAPQIVPGNFECEDNLLQSLEYAPNTILGNLEMQNNKIKTLFYCPVMVSGTVNLKLNFKNKNKEIFHIRTFEQLWDTHMIEKSKFLLEKELKKTKGSGKIRTANPIDKINKLNKI